ncbi:MAG: HEAT repeat domain-containing protein [Pirellulaceae bacterium]
MASSQNYPQLKPGAEPTDQIVVLEDTDGDGVSDKRTVFADNMMIPTGVLPGDGGVYVANSTQLIHLTDTDGDGLSDTRRTVLSGFGTEDTHHLLHTLRWRPDGRMAMSQSIYIHSHLETPYGVKHLDGGGAWHFDPHTSQLEVFFKGLVNPWGHAIDAYGQSFATDGAGGEGINYPFPGAVFVTSPGATRWLRGLNPGSPKHCGLEFVSGAAMPDEMQQVLITNDFRGHRVCRFKLERQGSGYRSIQLPDLIRSEHIAFRPIDIKMGPDGAIYIADWYNPIIQHGEVDFRDPRRDTEHGRIWRITAKGHDRLQPPDYQAASEDDLVAMLEDSALWVRQFARQELSSRPWPAVQSALAKLQSPQPTTPASAYLALQPLWLQLSRREIDAELIDRLRQHIDPRVRAAAMRVIGEQHVNLPKATTWLENGIGDTDDQVVLEAVCGLHRIGTMPAVLSVLQAAERADQDQNLKFAIWNALRDTESIWLPVFERNDLANTSPAALEALADAASGASVAKALATQIVNMPAAQQPRAAALIASRGDAASVATLTQWIIGGDQTNADKVSMLDSVLTQCQARKLVPDEVSQWLPKLVGSAQTTPQNSQWIILLAKACQQWRAADTAPTLNQWLNEGIASQQPALVAAAASALAESPTGEGRQIIRQISGNQQLDISLRSAAIAAAQ